jgi:hypothetical protein
MIIGAVILLAVGCGNEDNTQGPADADEVTTLVIGNVILRPYVDFQMNMLQIYAQDHEIDSVLFGDSLCDMGQSVYYVWGNEYNYWAAYFNQADSLRFNSGDVVRVYLFNDDRVTSVDIKLLSNPEDSIRFTVPELDTVIDVGESFELVWRRIANADWYGMQIYYWYDSAGQMASRNGFVATTDTTYLFPGADHPSDGRYGLNMVAVSGPVPGTGDYNLQGQSIVGSLYSTSRHTYGRIVVGAGPPPLSADKIDGDSITEGDVARKILRGVTGR